LGCSSSATAGELGLLSQQTEHSIATGLGGRGCWDILLLLPTTTIWMGPGCLVF